MSQAKNHSRREWQDVVAKLRRVHYRLSVRTTPTGSTDLPIPFGGSGSAGSSGGNEFYLGATSEQASVIADGYGALLMVWADLVSFPLNYTSILNLCSLLSRVPVDSVVACLKECDRLLLEEVQGGSPCSFSGFKHQINKRFPEVKGLIAPMQGLWEEMRATDCNPLLVRRLHTCFSFITRLNIPDREDLQAQARVDFLKHEESLLSRSVIQDGTDRITLRSVYTTDEEDIIGEWFPNIIPVYQHLYGKWIPKHGNGSVADVKGLDLGQKYDALGCDDDLAYLDAFTGGPGCRRPNLEFERIAKVTFVPKSVDKLRTICMEPATLMFYQQGFMSTIVSYIHGHSYLRKRINLSKAELNAELAKEGSYRGDYATIDLSAASDSVSWRLVRQWFARTPLWEALSCTRSDHYDLDDTIRESGKFAPMGSALCFPTECLIFAAMCEATIRTAGADPSTSRYRVYGDDIIIEHEFAEDLIRRLEANGFKVNVSKSFYKRTPNIFRESCGGEYLNGSEVTPIRISRKFAGFSPRSESEGRWYYDHCRFEGLVDMANRSYFDLPTLRSYIVSELLMLPRSVQPFFTDDFTITFNEKGEKEYLASQNGGLLTVDPTNYRLRREWSTNQQCTVLIHGTAQVNPGVVDEWNESTRLYEWLRSTAGRSWFDPLRDEPIFISRKRPTRSTELRRLVRSRGAEPMDRDYCPSLPDPDKWAVVAGLNPYGKNPLELAYEEYWETHTRILLRAQGEEYDVPLTCSLIGYEDGRRKV